MNAIEYYKLLKEKAGTGNKRAALATSKPQGKAHLAINTVLDYATPEEKRMILDWFDRTAANLIMSDDSREGISEGDYFRFLELAEREWGKPKRERPARENPDRPKLVLLQGGAQ